MHLVLIALALLAACVIVQSLGTLVMIHWVARVRQVFESPHVFRRVGLLLALFTFIVLLHLIQIALWAMVFWREGELPTL
jgi:voltage-gated potassium channel